MVKKAGISIEVAIAILIALASLATALAAWRINVVSSSASDANRNGLIDAIKQAASQGEDWRKVYQEAGFARDYLAGQAAVAVLEASSQAPDITLAANLRQYLLPNLAGMSESFGNDPSYRLPQGTFDVQKRFQELEASAPDLAELDPAASFKKAARLYQEQRLLTIGVVLLAAGLFWLGMAEISPGRVRAAALIVGSLIFLGSLGFLVIVEGVFVLLQRGLP